MTKFRSIWSVAVLLSVIIISGCGDNGNNEPTVLFEDHFEYPVNDVWTPTNGWLHYGPGGTGHWKIVTGGISGNALQFDSDSTCFLINDYSDSDYQISVRVKPINMIGGTNWPFSIIGRAQDSSNFYAAAVYVDSGTGYTYLTLKKEIDGTSSSINTTEQTVQFKTGALDPDAFYTLTLTVNGNTITATLNGEGLNSSLSGSATDFTTGKVGIRVVGFSGYKLLFDDFVVTAP